MSFISITVFADTKDAFVSCSSDNMAYFPDMKAGWNMAKVKVTFPDLHDRFMQSGFELVSTAPAAVGHVQGMHHFYKRRETSK
jgi:hypothetical protein